MEVLTEQETYTLYNGEPLKKDLQLKACDNELKLLFNGATTLFKTPIHDIPSHKFDFKPISDFLGGSYKHDQLYVNLKLYLLSLYKLEVDFQHNSQFVGEDHPQIYPTYLDALLKKKLDFRVKYTTTFGQ
ncbi:unnamed protein product [Vicia faba]|uniref:Uncharacterized protein n=1 Tax=Vicia faba TaxID=3906 RepID=A0AAV0YZN9_VICFA|nr:unnamed protein product [Vicia faba]